MEKNYIILPLSVGIGRKSVLDFCVCMCLKWKYL
uniref:Uncharacterized protein n=1 Tax=Anguilla anguilla TaxID=7936 RepID=A0A0E9SNU7_ANGAN